MDALSWLVGYVKSNADPGTFPAVMAERAAADLQRQRKDSMKIYLARPITGKSYDEVVGYYEDAKRKLEAVGYTVLQPMTGKAYLRNEVDFKAEGFTNPVSTNHAIVERDNWMVRQADVVYVNVEEADRVSIGCVMELAWAHELRRHTVLALPPENPHRHAFVLECADVVLGTHAEAMVYLVKLAAQEA